MNRRAFLALGGVAVAPALIAAPKREPFDEAIGRGLLYLRRTQSVANGSWAGLRAGFGGVAAPDGGDPAITALAVMAFLSAGHVPGEGPHGAAVEKGIRYVMNGQQRNGLLGVAHGGMTEMYHHGICSLMLAEAAGMTSGPLAAELVQRLESAVKVVLNGQRSTSPIVTDRGGWRYTVTGADADLSVTGWQLLALRGARNLGCDVPADRIQAAVEYVRRCHDRQSGGFRYTVRDRVTVACTGTGILALELCGKEYHKSAEVLAAGQYILFNDLDPRQAHFFYGIYYTSQAMFQIGDDFWKRYRPRLHGLLLQTNPPKGDGSWQAGGPAAHDDGRWGPNYCTAMAILALTVEYRYLPIYQRFEEPIEVE
jgi:hypothetical protein